MKDTHLPYIKLAALIARLLTFSVALLPFLHCFSHLTASSLSLMTSFDTSVYINEDVVWWSLEDFSGLFY